MTKYLVWKPHGHIAETERFVGFCIDEWDTKSHYVFVICKKEGGGILGMIDAKIDGFKVNFGYVLAKSYWINGYTPKSRFCQSFIINYLLFQNFHIF